MKIKRAKLTTAHAMDFVVTWTPDGLEVETVDCFLEREKHADSPEGEFRMIEFGGADCGQARMATHIREQHEEKGTKS